jgi:glucose/arabinose dehydrogenase
MKIPFFSLVSLISCGWLLAGLLSGPTQEPAKTGPQTEKRFPPLAVPTGFKATLFACDPLIEYPSVIARGPKPGSLFVAIDYMTGLGIDIVRRDEIRLIEDTDGDGYADKATVVATGFNSIQGLTYHDGTLYVMHAPYLSAVTYPPVPGKLDQRRDLLTGIGPPPEKDQIRLHNANGVVIGHDGWLYLAIGDHGANIVRPEGDRFVFENGGILRCRPDGTDLHPFATGLRNIYDVAIDEDLNIFVRDNENDGGDYKIRVCHSFFGADHGYPYLYWERPDEAMPPLADLGLGSSAGGACYLERHFPPEFRGNLFFCEWGRSVVRYRPDRVGASFAQPKEIEFAAGAANDPYGFKPTDIVVDHDGTLLVSDWADGQRPRRGRGRIYRITYLNSPLQKVPPPVNDKTPLAEIFTRLDSYSYFERMAAQEALLRRDKAILPVTLDALFHNQIGVRAQLHSVLIVARLGGMESLANLLDLARSNIDPRVQVQAIRAIADLTDPVLMKHKLDAGRGDPQVATRLAKLVEGRDARVMLEGVIALGRLRWDDAPGWLHRHVKPDDPAIAHAAQITLRNCSNWPVVLKLLDEPSSDSFRKIAVRAVAGQYESTVIDGLIGWLSREKEPKRRQEYADLLSRVYKKPATPWTYWGFRPPPRPANTVAWERTDAIATALDGVLTDPDAP